RTRARAPRPVRPAHIDALHEERAIRNDNDRSFTMPTTTGGNLNPPAHTHADAAALFRRPFAPGAIGFRAMSKVPYNGDPFGGAQVAAYIGGQSVVQRLNAVVPGRWRMEFRPIDPPPGSKRLYMACRLTISLSITEGAPDV